MKNNFYFACKEANEEIATLFDGMMEEHHYKKYEVGAGGDRSSGLDLMAEAIFVKYLGKFGKIESEESGSIGDGEETIVLDPLDGSSNALSNFPYFGTSVARIDKNGVLQDAVVCNLASKEIFFKSSEAPTRKGKLFSAKIEEPLETHCAEIGIFEKAYSHPDIVLGLQKLGLKFRAPGAVALSLAYAHSVNFVLFVGPYRIYDFAGGLAFCDDLEVVVEEDYVIVSQSKEIVQALESLVRTTLYEHER